MIHLLLLILNLHSLPLLPTGESLKPNNSTEAIKLTEFGNQITLVSHRSHTSHSLFFRLFLFPCTISSLRPIR
uniref:Secreted protein n=1 Tax=Cannabis sativa TaxID=3483 RepID=A0A803R5Z5_CANSA